jgi:hypothetical protein
MGDQLIDRNLKRLRVGEIDIETLNAEAGDQNGDTSRGRGMARGRRRFMNSTNWGIQGRNLTEFPIGMLPFKDRP